MSLHKAEEFLAAADTCLRHGHHNASASRSYYSMFHAAQHALQAAGIKTEKWSHEGIQSAFSRELIHRRKIHAADLTGYLSKSMRLRIRADYDKEDVSASQANKSLRHAQTFVTAIKEKHS